MTAKANGQQSDLFGPASTRPCSVCQRHFIGVVPNGLCPQCEKNTVFYRQTRQRGDPRNFLDYPELLAQWKNRRKECQEWRKTAEQAAHDRGAREQSERETRYLLLALLALDSQPDLDALAELGKAQAETEKLKATIEELKTRLKANSDELLNARLASLRGWEKNLSPAIPQEQWRRLVQLAHPDKHNGSAAATEAMKWLLEVRP